MEPFKELMKPLKIQTEFLKILTEPGPVKTLTLSLGTTLMNPGL